MADKSKIDWTDATWNPIVGCSIISPACTNCYAMAMAARIERMNDGAHKASMARDPEWGAIGKTHYAGLTQRSKAGPVWTGEIGHAPDHILYKPMTWRTPRRVFVNSMSDLFHDGVPDWKIAEIYGVMIAAHHLRGHTFQWLTKRSARARKMLNDTGFWDEANNIAGQEILDRCDPLSRRKDDARATCDDYSSKNPPQGIWAGVTAEDQTRADERVPDLLATPAAKRFASCEPLLGQIDFASIHPEENILLDFRDTPTHKMRVNALSGWWWQQFLEDGQWTEFESTDRGFEKPYQHARLDWVIAGGESGPRARPSHPDWFRDLRDDCAKAGVPFFFKQWGEWAPGETIDDPQDRTTLGAWYFAGQWRQRPVTVREGEEMHFDDEPDVWRVGKARAGHLLDGREHREFPS